MYQALYRKYRPKDFDSVIGQRPIIRTLKNSIINNNFSHAYMFFGPRGTGKTTVSKIFARNVNCLNPKDGIACKECDSCINSFSNGCVDIIEIDAASNNGVDEIRELRNNINLVPANLKYKVYIVDEVHMLSIGAFNALLKTLEEPPEHVIFILATTDPQKVPDTIVSRCQCFSFKRISSNDIYDRLKFVSKKENIDIDNNVLKKIAVLSDGGLRDALGSLDKLVSYSDKKISLNDFYDISGSISDDDIYSFLKSVFTGDVSVILNKIKEFNDCGKNLIQIIVQIINYLRDNIVDYYLLNKELISTIDLEQSLINLLNDKLFDIKKSGNTKIYFEMIILKYINDYCDLNNNDFIKSKGDNKVENFDKNVILATNDDIIKDDIYDIDDTVDHENNNNNKITNLEDIISCRVNNTMATADKKLLLEEVNKFELLKDFSFDQKVGALVNSLLDSKIRACGKNDFIISYSSTATVEQNLENLFSLNDVYNDITGSDKLIAIVSDKRWNEIKNDYISNLKNGVKYKLLKEPDPVFEVGEKDDIITSSAVDLFGKDIVEFE